MGKKIFVSYKYADESVANLYYFQNSRVRDYVDEFERMLEYSDNIYKGESDDEDLSWLSDEMIWERLKDRIYDSSVTVVFISPRMRDAYKPDKNQWIPWEISYSLKETSRRNIKGESITSHTNAMLAVVLPDMHGSYSYYIEEMKCCANGCIKYNTGILFDILSDNMFNRINGYVYRNCVNERMIWDGEHSYIEAVKWSDFINGYQYYVNKAIARQENVEDYKLRKEV